MVATLQEREQLTLPGSARQSSPAGAARRGLGERMVQRIGLGALGIAVAVGAWALAAEALGNPARLPSPAAVSTFLSENLLSTPGIAYAGIAGSLWSNALFTAEHTLEGFGIGATCGYLLGLALGAQIPLKAIANSVLVLYASLPAVILSPFVVLWFGPNGLSELVIVAFYVFVLVAIAAQNAANTLADRYVDWARSLGARQRDVLLHVLLPGCLPSAMGVARVALAVGWGLEVATELFGANRGVGRLVLYYQQTGSPTGIIASILLLAGIALAIELAMRMLLRLVTSWQEKTAGGSL